MLFGANGVKLIKLVFLSACKHRNNNKIIIMKATIISVSCSHEDLERNGHGKKKLVTPKSLSPS